MIVDRDKPLPQPGNDGSLYKTPEWKAIRAKRLYKERHCRMCAAMGIRTKAFIVDHIKPHRGYRGLFFDYANTQSLCKLHHDGLKQSAERLGYSKGVSDDGWPADPQHPVNRLLAGISRRTSI